MSDAYAVARCLAQDRQAAGHCPIGQKIGLTHRPIWERLGVEEPVWAPVYADSTTRGSQFSLDPLVSPRLEVEFVLKLRRPLSRGATLPEALDAVEWVALGFEIVDCHYPGWSCRPPDIVADHGLHAGLVVGEARRCTPAELLSLPATVVAATCDDVQIADGAGRDVLEGPVQAVVELLASSFAQDLQAGDLVSTGALTRTSHPVAPGQTWAAQIADGLPLPPVKVRFDL